MDVEKLVEVVRNLQQNYWDMTKLEYVSHWMPMPEKPQPPKGE